MTRLLKLAFYLAVLVALIYQYWPFGFEFRGYDLTSSCDEVIGAELQLGGSFASRSHEDLGLLDEVDVTRLDIELFGQPTYVDVACREDTSVYAIWYIVRTENLNEQWEIYEHFSSGLNDLFGPVDEYDGGAVRTRNYFCSHRGGLSLHGGVYESGIPNGEVSVYVSLDRDPCL